MGLDDAARRRDARNAQVADANRQAKVAEDAREAAYMAAVTRLDPLLQRFSVVVQRRFARYRQQFRVAHRLLLSQQQRPEGVGFWDDSWRRKFKSSHSVAQNVTVTMQDGTCISLTVQLPNAINGCPAELIVVPSETVWYVNCYKRSMSDYAQPGDYVSSTSLSNEALLYSGSPKRWNEQARGRHGDAIGAWHLAELGGSAPRVLEVAEELVVECLDQLGIPYSAVTC